MTDMNGLQQTRPLPDPHWPHWYKDAVIYQLHIKAFCDANDDGIGDFRGLISRLDYIQTLGVNTIWLLPFYPSPLRDDGYDVSDYHNVHPNYGTRQDFRALVREAHRRGLRVITEMIINHTSDQHPWFQAARRAPPGSVKRNYYVWSDSDKKYAGTRIIFTDTERSNWSWDEVAGAYYWHRFFSHQPDLNFDNPHVLKALLRTLRFWLDMGVDGFRLDAIPYLVEREGTSNENLPETHEVIREIRALIERDYSDRLLLAEANMWPEDVTVYFGDEDECHMAYHFPLMPRMYVAMAQEDRHPVVEIMEQTPEIPESCQWAIFLRNHDELTLEMVTSEERDYMYRMYAADPRARINLGIRRRLAPLLDNDTERIKLMNSLLFSMPGSPIVYYGDEIGMGDNIYLGDRNGVRTPMQWSPDRNAGFSRADPQRLYLPPVMDAVFGFESVNVEAQTREPTSLLNWMRRILAVRRSSRVFGRGTLRFLKPGNRKILAYVREHAGEVVLCVANLGRTAQPVELDLSDWNDRVPVEMFGGATFPPIGQLPYLLTLSASGFYWFRLSSDAAIPPWHETRRRRDDLPVVVLFDGWSSFFRDRVVPWRIAMAVKTRKQLESDIVPVYLRAQNWRGVSERVGTAVQLVDHGVWRTAGRAWMMALFDIQARGTPHAVPDTPPLCYLPLSLAWESSANHAKGDADPGHTYGAAILAKTRQQAEVGVLIDALADGEFCRALVASMLAGTRIDLAEGQMRFVPTRVCAALVGDSLEYAETLAPRSTTFAGADTTINLGDRLFLKVYRQVRQGIQPEFEMGQFLTDVAHFAYAVPLAGALQYQAPAGSLASEGTDNEASTLILMQASVTHRGDGLSYTLEALERFLKDAQNVLPGGLAALGTVGTTGPADPVVTMGSVELQQGAPTVGSVGPLAPAESAEPVAPFAPVEPLIAIDPVDPLEAFGAYLELARTLGERCADLHRALCTPGGGPAFDSEPISAVDLRTWQDEALTVLDQALNTASHNDPGMASQSMQSAPARYAELRARIAALGELMADAGVDVSGSGLSARTTSLKIRVHGDLDLSQVLLCGHDFMFIDFEGDTRRPLAERRRKQSPMRDVASMAASLGLAGRSALQRLASLAPDSRNASAQAILAAHLQAWENASRVAFIGAYRDALTGHVLALPDTLFEGLLTVFEIEWLARIVVMDHATRPDRAAGALSCLAAWPPQGGTHLGRTK